MKKRLIATLLVLCMVLGMLPSTARAEESDFTIRDGVLAKYNGPGGAVVIPDGVITIGDSAFNGCSAISSITMPNSVTSIAGMAFFGCSGLTSITIPEKVTSVGVGAFQGCSRLANVTIPDGVAHIESSAFYDCSRLTSITIPGSVSCITPNMFANCSNLTNVVIEYNEQYSLYLSISYAAFSNCNNLVSITIPKNVDLIGSGAFYGCSSLTDVYYAGSEEDWGKIIIDNENNGNHFLTDAIIHYNSTGSEMVYNYEITTPLGISSPDDPTHFVVTGLQNESWKINGPIENFLRLYIDGKELEQNTDYTLKSENGVLITINRQALSNLGSDAHTIAAEFQDTPQPKRVVQNFYIESASVEIPGIIALYPANRSTFDFANTSADTRPRIFFDREVADVHGGRAGLDFSNGTLQIRRALDNVVVYEVEESSFGSGYSKQVLLWGEGADALAPKAVRLIDATPKLDYDTEYYVTMPAGFIKMADGSESPEIKKGKWTFKTVKGTSAQEYNFSYSLDGGSWSLPEECYIYSAGEQITISVEIPQKTGYIFRGWSDGSSVYQAKAVYTMPAKDVILKAVWEKDETKPIPQYAFSYYLDGGTGNISAACFNYPEGEIIRLTTEKPTKKGYLFDGWTDGKNAYKSGDSFTMPAQEVILRAVWKESPDSWYEIVYDLNGGTWNPPIPTEQHLVGSSVLLPTQIPVKPGCDFGGWTDGTTTYQSGVSFTMPGQKVILTAQWTEGISTKAWGSPYEGNIATKAARTPEDALQVYNAVAKRTSPEIAQRIYNLLFVAQYRPTALGGDYWAHLNGEPYIYSVNDKGLGKKVNFWGSTGCLSYAKFAEKYILQDGGGNLKYLRTGLKDMRTEERIAEIKNFFNLYASPGEAVAIRHDLSNYHIHYILYLLHDDNGLYFLSYPGNTAKAPVSLYFCEWEKFNEILREHDGYYVNINNVIAGNPGKAISGISDCPVELEISYNGEILTSQNNEGTVTASFGVLYATGTPEDRTVTFNLEYHPDYKIRLLGTATGYANFKLEFTYEDNSTCYREYLNIPISSTTQIEASDSNINGGIALYIYEDNSPKLNSCWYANIDETVSEPREDMLIGINGGAAIVDTTELPVPPSYPHDGLGDSSNHVPFAYHITLPVLIGGKVAVNTTSASKGTTVTLTATPDEGYNLSSLTVTDSKGNELELTDKGDSKYTFVMPASAVTVNAVFEKVEPAESTPIDGTYLFPFTDVLRTDWFCNAVEYVFTNDLMSGIAPYTFDPQGKMNRAMVWTVLGRMADADVDGSESPWYSKAQAWALSNNISDGTNPTNSISRQELMTMLWRYIGSPAATADLNKFSDSESVADWADNAMQWAVSTGLIVGDNGRLNPTGDARRCEVAMIFMRYCENSAE